MREILFRGKRTDNGEWVFGMAWIFKEKTMICPWHEGMCKYDTGYYPVQVIPETFGQYSGSTDKNGKKIFEGDIIKIDDKYVRYIEYSGECSAFVKFRYIDKLTSEFSGYLGKGYDNYKQTIEIVGNIHDNPELLKGGETNGK